MTIATASSDDVRRALERTSAGTPAWQATAKPTRKPRKPKGPWALDAAKLTAWLEEQDTLQVASSALTGAPRFEQAADLNSESFGEHEGPAMEQLLDLAREAGALTEPADLQVVIVEARWQGVMVGVRRTAADTCVMRPAGVNFTDLTRRAHDRKGPKLICDLITGLLTHINLLAKTLPTA